MKEASAREKGKIYKKVVRPAMMYREAELKMLRLSLGMTRRYRI